MWRVLSTQNAHCQAGPRRERPNQRPPAIMHQSCHANAHQIECQMRQAPRSRATRLHSRTISSTHDDLLEQPRGAAAMAERQAWASWMPAPRSQPLETLQGRAQPRRGAHSCRGVGCAAEAPEKKSLAQALKRGLNGAAAGAGAAIAASQLAAGGATTLSWRLPPLAPRLDSPSRVL